MQEGILDHLYNLKISFVLSIKSKQFTLAQVYAVEVIHELTESANLPFVVGAIDKATHERAEYVVKLNSSERMIPNGRMFELIGAFMAIELDLSVVVPVIVDVSEDFIELQKGKDHFLRCSKSLGYNYGSEFVKGLLILDNHIALTGKQKDVAQEILAFDMLIRNVDRNAEKPNMITDGNTLLLLDHEAAFAFVREMPWDKNIEPWNFNELDKGVLFKHCLFSRVKGNIEQLDEFSEKMTRFDDDFWDRAKSIIPNEWFSEDSFNIIKTHVDLMVKNRAVFIQNIKLLLS
ncbi:hypothetical protein I6I98_08680 [Sphingobacterium multivorum]|uniref:HipA-like kinase domain-containing protein n=1 Tax=Sphingobacterium multivorum TaxID=28454 RepID=A0ABX7CYF3_SPHMU|nr:HipA family kinase [Sphingobacterium multivorum]QQT55312.1 hypothetical protein I6I98_08680 [Sphingobacterium multivorum]